MKRADLNTLTVLRAVVEGQTGALGKLCERFPYKVVIAAYMREVDADRLEYGVSINYPWLTPKGRRYLNPSADAEATARTAGIVNRSDNMGAKRGE